MRVNIPMTNLKNALAPCARICVTSSIPVLTGVLIEADEDSLTLTTTDLDIFVSRRVVNVATDEPGMVLVNARQLLGIISSMDGGDVVLATDGDMMTVRCQAASFAIQTMSDDDFPGWPGIKESQSVLKLDAEQVYDLTRALTVTAPFVANNDPRTFLNGPHLIMNESRQLVESTNGHALARTSVNLPTPEGKAEIDIIIPKKAVEQLGALLDHCGHAVLTLAPANLTAENPDTGDRLAVRLIEGDYPDTDMVVPREPRFVTSIDPQTLMAAASRARLTTSTGMGIHLTCGADSDFLRVESVSEFGSFGEDTDCHPETEMDVGVNADYLTKAISAMVKGAEDPVINLSNNDSLSPITVELDGDEHGTIMIVMPMRIS